MSRQILSAEEEAEQVVSDLIYVLLQLELSEWVDWIDYNGFVNRVGHSCVQSERQ